MVFKVNFICDRGYVAIGYHKTTGLRHVALIRKELGVELPLYRIEEGTDPIYYSSIQLELTEEQAIEAGRFEEASNVHVTIPAESLNHRIEEVVKWKADQQTGEILTGSITYTFEKEGLVDEWIKAGAPLNWEI